MSRREAAIRRGLPPTAGVSVPTDRHYRRSDVRPGRRRFNGVAFKVGLALIALLTLVGAGAWLTQLLVNSPLLAVSKVMVRGTNRLNANEVAALVSDLRGQSILRVDFEAYRRRLLDSPWVAEVALSRRLPATVDIRIVERVPMAVARLGQQLYLVDDTGVIIDQFGPQYADFDFPIVDGLVRSPGAGATPVDAARLALASRLLTAIAGAPAIRARVSQVDVSDARDAVVVIDGDTARLHIGADRFVERLTGYVEIAEGLRQRLPGIDYVDLRFEDRVFVRAGTRQANLGRQSDSRD